MRARIWGDVLVPLVAVVAISAFAYATLFGGDAAESSSESTVKASAAAKAEAAGLPPCTGEGEPVNFAYFTLGPGFAGLEQSEATRRCDRPRLLPDGVVVETSAGPRHTLRANYASLTYGDCEASGDSGCALPLVVQTWPACERNAGMYYKAKRPDLQIRGAPAGVFEAGRRVELYTGRATVKVFGETPALAMRAARAVAPVASGSKFPSPVTATAARAGALGPLAQPATGAMKGQLECRQVSTSSRGGV